MVDVTTAVASEVTVEVTQAGGRGASAESSGAAAVIASSHTGALGMRITATYITRAKVG